MVQNYNPNMSSMSITTLPEQHRRVEYHTMSNVDKRKTTNNAGTTSSTGSSIRDAANAVANKELGRK